MCCIDEQENKYSVLNECSRMLKYNRVKKAMPRFLSTPIRAWVTAMQGKERRTVHVSTRRTPWQKNSRCLELYALRVE
jgi:hypothetical protein